MGFYPLKEVSSLSRVAAGFIALFLIHSFSLTLLHTRGAKFPLQAAC